MQFSHVSVGTEILKAWLLNKKSGEIADQLKISNSEVAEILTEIDQRTNSLKESINLMKESGLIEPLPSLKLSRKSKDVDSAKGSTRLKSRKGSTRRRRRNISK